MSTLVDMTTNAITWNTLSEITDERFYELRADLYENRRSFEPDETIEGLKLGRSIYDSNRYEVIYNGVGVGWVVKAGTTGTWWAYACTRGSVMGKLVDENRVRKVAVANLLFHVALYW